MSRKDFEIIAKHISEIADRNTRVEAATAVAAACMKINTRFNITKFYEACNVLLQVRAQADSIVPCDTSDSEQWQQEQATSENEPQLDHGIPARKAQDGNGGP